jgi:hypothetical protein
VDFFQANAEENRGAVSYAARRTLLPDDRRLSGKRATADLLSFRSPASGLRHFLRHVKQQTAVRLLDATEQVSKATEKARIFSCVSPRIAVAVLSPWKIGDLRRFVPVVKQLVHRNFHRPRQFLKGFDGWNGVAVLDARDVAPE